jgi:hypothetical protein
MMGFAKYETPLESGPFVDWLREQKKEAEASLEAFSAFFEVDSRWMSRMLSGQYRHTGLSTVDRCFVRAGDPGALYRLYPLED